MTPTVSLDGDAFVVEWEHGAAVLKQCVPCRKRSEGVFTVPATYANAYRLAVRVPYAAWGDDAKEAAAALHDAAVHRAARVTPVDGLSPAQETGVAWLLSGSGLLADQMGSGKTVQACVALRERSGPVAVVCPNSVVDHWVEHIEKWTGRGARAITSAIAPYERPASLRGAVDTDMAVVVPWSQVAGLAKQAAFGHTKLPEQEAGQLPLSETDWDVLIVDEAHRAKNPSAAQTRAVWSIQATTVWALTGTPVSESPLDWWSMLRLIDPRSWPSRTRYANEYCTQTPMFWGGSQWMFGPALPELRQLTDWLMLRRTMDEVIGRHIVKDRTVRKVHLPAKHRKLYDDLRENLLLELQGEVLTLPNALAAATRLQQMAAAHLEADGDGNYRMCMPSPKCEMLAAIIDELGDEQLVVMSSSKQLLHLASAKIAAAGYTTAEVSGDVTGDARTDEIAAFQSGERQIMFATTGAGGEGIDLSAASRLVMLQRPYSLVQSAQAEARVRRWTQEKGAVEIIDVVTADTVDERIRVALQAKSTTASQITGAEILQLL